MMRLEQITAIVLAAGLAIPSYWFFWTLAGGGGYDRRESQPSSKVEQIKEAMQHQSSKAPHEL